MSISCESGNADIESVFPETLSKIAAARRVPNVAWTPKYRNLASLMADQVARDPNKNFLTFSDDHAGCAYTYSEIYNMVLRTAALMQELPMRVGVGDRVATLCINDP